MKINSIHAQSGVMLIEAMVGALIFLVGIIALMGMQAAAMSTTSEAKYRSDAAYYASQIISRIWTDRTNVAGYHTCSGGVVNQEVTYWRAEVAASLPGASAVSNLPSVCVVSSAGGFDITVTVFWSKPGDVNAGAPVQHKFTAVSRVDFN